METLRRKNLYGTISLHMNKEEESNDDKHLCEEHDEGLWKVVRMLMRRKPGRFHDD